MDKTDFWMEKNARMVPGIRMNWSKIENRRKKGTDLFNSSLSTKKSVKSTNEPIPLDGNVRLKTYMTKTIEIAIF
ncbi:MAG: hypothetical protein U9R66_04350 [Thermodesulfobacteriota bacterium]|nr:hypothetical protein [Thermodesulfobacteriota bacterium]